MKGDDVTKLPPTLDEDDEAWSRAAAERLIADEPWPTADEATGAFIGPHGELGHRQPHPLVADEVRRLFEGATSAAGLDAPVTAEPLTPDDNGIVMFPPDVVDSIARMDAARARLRSLGARHVDLGQCEHGWVAGVKIQRGRAHKELIAHGAPLPAQALEELAMQIEAMPPERRKKGRRGR